MVRNGIIEAADVNKYILDRAGENVVAGDYNWGCYCGCGSNTSEDVSSGLRGCWTSCDERRSLLGGESGGGERVNVY